MKASFHIHDPHSERVLGRCAPYDPPRSSNKQKEQAPFACSPHFERVVAPAVPTLPHSGHKHSNAFRACACTSVQSG